MGEAGKETYLSHSSVQLRQMLYKRPMLGKRMRWLRRLDPVRNELQSQLLLLRLCLLLARCSREAASLCKLQRKLQVGDEDFGLQGQIQLQDSDALLISI